MFIVDKDFEGFTFSEPYDKLGIRSSVTAELHFDNVKVPKENLLGELGKGFKQAMMILDGGRIGIAAQALGISQGAYESAKDYTIQREQFNRPIAQFQNTQFMLADMATQIKAARLLVYDAADKKENHEKGYGKDAAMAKLFASDLADKVTSDALQLYGGSGFIKGVDVERHYRDAKITQIYEGTNQIMRVVIASYLLPRPKKSENKETSEKKRKAKSSIVGDRKKEIFKGDPRKSAKKLVEALKADGYTFDKKDIDPDNAFEDSDRVVSFGMGIGEEQNKEVIKQLAKETGAAIGGSRPVAEVKRYLPLDRYIGLSGQKFKGDLYIAVGISGELQHLHGIKDVKTIVVINNNESAPFFKNCDYGIVGDFHEVVPALIEEIKNA